METPDCWVMLKCSYEGKVVYKILAGWYGGYDVASWWKLNSGVVKAESSENAFDFYGSSGSVYRCNKNSYRMSGLMSGVVEQLKEKILLQNLPDTSLVVMQEDTEFLNVAY